MTDQQSDDTFLEQVAEAFEFPLEDLEANRAGYLSPSQTLRFKARAGFQLAVMGLTFSLAMVAVVLYFLRPSLPTLGVCLVWFGLLSLLGFIRWRDCQPILKDLKDKKVRRLTGAIRKSFTVSSVKGNSARFNSVHIKGVALETSLAIYNALSDDQRYRIYYAPHTQTLLSVEPFSSEA